MKEGNYIKLGDLEIYKMAVDLSKEAWEIYSNLEWRDKKVMGDQFIRSIDSVGASIAEGYGRFHYKDRIKFYYNSRASLLEAKHWILLLHRRNKIIKQRFQVILNKSEEIHKKLNSHIKSCYAKISNI